MYMTDVYDPVRETSSRGPLRFPPPLLYFAGFMAGLGLELALPTAQPAGGVRIAAGAVAVAALLGLDTAATIRFARAGTPVNPMKSASALITSGPYRLTRNPMYLGMAVVYAGLAVATGVLWALAALPLVLFAVDRLVIAREERHLLAVFGAPYEAYRARVRRWL